MSKTQTPFFATHGDLVAIALEVMAFRKLDFVLGGVFPEPTLTVLKDVHDLGVCEIYLVVEHGSSVGLRSVPQRTGGQKYAVDQIENPHAIALHTGGPYTDRHLIAGQVGIVGKNRQSDDLYALFRMVIQKRFEKIKSFYVGPEAIAMLEKGARLSATPKAPQLYDLIR